MANPFHGQNSPTLSVFSFQESFGIRVFIDEQGNPELVLADICKAVDYSNPSKAQELIDVDDLTKREVIDSMGRKQIAICCTEPGLYQFLCSSQVEKAKPFRRWVFAEVIPAIRRTGHYGRPSLKESLALRGQLIKALDALAGCRCAFSKRILFDQVSDLCRQLGQPVPNAALIGQDPAQTDLEGF